MRSMVLAAMMLTMAGAAAAQPPTAAPAPMVRAEGLKSVSKSVQVIPDNSVPVVPNVGFVVGTTGVLVVDTGLGPANGAAVAAVARRIAPGRKIYLVATHAHPEHDLGAQAFPAGSVLIRSKDQVADGPNDMVMAGRFAGRTPEMAQLLKDAKFRPADETFEHERTLDLGGGVRAQIIALGPNHTAGDTAVWVAADKVLFSGDVAMRPQPSMTTPAASMAQWMRSLDRLEGLKPTVVVPSHGPVGDVGFIQGYRAYLKEIAERTAAAKAAGQSLEQATASVTEAMAARYPDRGRLGGAIQMAYRD